MLDKNKDIILKVLPLICVTIGAYFLLNSTEIGNNQTNRYVKTMGGSIDNKRFLAHFNANTETYRVFGSILLAVGLIPLLKKR